MTTPAINMSSQKLNASMLKLSHLFPGADRPALMRLEPDSTTGDPTPGARAELADPAWMLGRQWQFGELTGENAGSAVSVSVQSSAYPITAWAPLDDVSAADPKRIQWRPWPKGAVLEELIGHIPMKNGLRQRGESGAQLADMLTEAGEDDLAARLTATYPLLLDPAKHDALDPQASRLLNVLTGTTPDGDAICAAMESNDTPWLAAANNEATTKAVLEDWRIWSTGAPESGGAWTTGLLEYRFALRFGDGVNATVLRGTRFGAAEIRWSDLEWMDTVKPPLPADAPVGTPVHTEAIMLATPLSYPGMPANRYWEMEDGLIDLAAIEAQPTDLARLALAEYAMTSGDDWLSVPVDGLLGAINQVNDVQITDSFGDSSIIQEASDPEFTMYRVTSGAGIPLPGIVLPPVSAGTVTGEAIEEILFLRDEMANLVWAIEQTVRGGSGDPRNRAAEPRPRHPEWPEDLSTEELLYRLQTLVPPEWIPLVPYAPVPGQVRLRKGALLRNDDPLLAVSHTLAPTPLDFPDEEIPREGVHLRAVPSLARRADGSYARWNAYRVRVAPGSAVSNLAWDSAFSIMQAGRA